MKIAIIGIGLVASGLVAVQSLEDAALVLLSYTLGIVVCTVVKL